MAVAGPTPTPEGQRSINLKELQGPLAWTCIGLRHSIRLSPYLRGLPIWNGVGLCRSTQAVPVAPSARCCTALRVGVGPTIAIQEDPSSRALLVCSCYG